MLTREQPDGRDVQSEGGEKGSEPQRSCQDLMLDFVKEGVE